MLFLWAPSPKLEEALQVMRAWGFDYTSCAVWDKGSIGPGYWFRQQHEQLLVGRRGAIRRPPEGVRVASVIRAPRREHSRKPDPVDRIRQRRTTPCASRTRASVRHEGV